ncbi:MAG: 3-deoxy-D-manno-octulosonic acid transferase [Hyphomicrobiales bacterium]|nr:3-deoxy-D-manno-octulosonic acid transferase [Hyphomicrobiales bacterium]
MKDRPPTPFLLNVYRAFGSVVARPLAPLVLSYRASRGKELRDRVSERYGRASQPRPSGSVVWVHAASVGETNAVLPLIRRVVESGHSVVLTTVTVTAAMMAAEKLPAGAVHQFSPIDIRRCVTAFLDHWRPDMAMFVESELWPEAIVTLDAAVIPLAIVNGRLSQRSFNGWRRHEAVAAALFQRVNLCLAQSEKDGERYRALGVPEVVVTGNLKFDAPQLGVDSQALVNLKAEIGDRPVWLAASTHHGEEAVVADAFEALAVQHPRLLTIIVPRHPHRGDEVAAMLADRGIRVARRSAAEQLSPTTQIYVADTLGELGLFYRVAPVAFVGGSLVDHGGQNPIEPVHLGVAVLHGPHTQNFHQVYDTLDGAVPNGRVAAAEELVANAGRLMIDAEARERSVTAAQAALAPFRGALDRTVNALGPVLSSRRRAVVDDGQLEPARS